MAYNTIDTGLTLPMTKVKGKTYTCNFCIYDTSKLNEEWQNFEYDEHIILDNLTLFYVRGTNKLWYDQATIDKVTQIGINLQQLTYELLDNNIVIIQLDEADDMFKEEK